MPTSTAIACSSCKKSAASRHRWCSYCRYHGRTMSGEKVGSFFEFGETERSHGQMLDTGTAPSQDHA
jgi:hypothetical protein